MFVTHLRLHPPLLRRQPRRRLQTPRLCPVVSYRDGLLASPLRPSLIYLFKGHLILKRRQIQNLETYNRGALSDDGGAAKVAAMAATTTTLLAAATFEVSVAHSRAD
ncbi:hypothetical protein Syun_004124 [Stephania yunnanensis]|uniref:Uncharacterized protein n=1 Tax=Stephania yunnanensis TaxID=152371 RepID=A0AAP0Q0G7_9MAGN